jgi:hypothetical protein
MAGGDARAPRKAERRGEVSVKRWWMGAALTLGIGTLAGGAAMQGTPSSGEESGWVMGYEKALTAARGSGKPVFLVFR